MSTDAAAQQSYRDIVAQSLADPAAFWGEAAGLIDWMARRRGIVRQSAPGRPELDRAWAAVGNREAW